LAYGVCLHGRRFKVRIPCRLASFCNGLSAIARSPALRVESVRIALTNVAATALRAENAEQALAGGPLTDEAIAAKAMSICDPAEDLRGDREYKIEMAGPMVRRALARAATRCR